MRCSKPYAMGSGQPHTSHNEAESAAYRHCRVRYFSKHLTATWPVTAPYADRHVGFRNAAATDMYSPATSFAAAALGGQ